MTSPSLTLDPSSIAPAPVVWRRAILLKAFWIAVAGAALIISLTAHPQYVESAIGAPLIMAASLVPSWIWVTGRIKGLPLFPIYSATFFSAFGLPLLYEHPIIKQFPATDQLVGALTVAGFLLVATFTWWQVGRRASRPPRCCLVMSGRYGDTFFLVALAIGSLITFGTSGHWLTFPPGIGSIVVAVNAALVALASFVLSFRAGSKALTAEKHLLFRIFFVALLMATLPGLLLISAMSFLAVAGLGFVLGARRIPWRSAIAVVCVFAFLHVGKGEVRNRYWSEDEDPVIGPGAYVPLLTTWVTTSLAQIAEAGSSSGDEGQSIFQRASLMHLLLYVETMTPDAVPYMDGETYAIIPSLLVPRIFSERKIASHEGTYLLNIHYGFQTREDTARTTIGFGLVNEAYANFGFVGVGILAVLLGIYYAVVARWALGTPVLSFRSLFAVIVASYSFQSEFATGVYVSALFQSTIALVLVGMLFMRTRDCAGAERSILE